MSSSLLEQAIVDANNLRQIALKHAQQSLLEKQSEDVKKAVNTILEQETPEVAAPSMDSFAPPPMDAMKPVADQTTPLDVPDEDADTSLITSPEQEAEVAKEVTKSKTFEKIPLAHKAIRGQKVKINFDKLEESLKYEDKLIDPAKLKAAAKDQNIAPFKEEDMMDEEEESLEEIMDLDSDYLTSNEGDQLEEISGIDGAPYIEDGGPMQTTDSLDYIGEMDKYRLDAESLANKGISSMEETDLGMDQIALDVMDEMDYDEDGVGDTEQGMDAFEEGVEFNEEYLEEQLNLDMDISLQGHLGFNPIHYKEQQNIIAALEAAKKNSENKAKKASKKNEELKESIKELQDALQVLTESYTELKRKNENLSKENRKMKDNLDNSQKNNTELYESLSQMVVSNSKLLYINKVLGNASLNERQKQSLVETISKADTAEKAKTIYETLQSGTQSAVRKTPESLSEAINRASNAYLNKSSTNESQNPVVDRLQILAGIKKR